MTTNTGPDVIWDVVCSVDWSYHHPLTQPFGLLFLIIICISPLDCKGHQSSGCFLAAVSLHPEQHLSRSRLSGDTVEAAKLLSPVFSTLAYILTGPLLIWNFLLSSMLLVISCLPSLSSQHLLAMLTFYFYILW